MNKVKITGESNEQSAEKVHASEKCFISQLWLKVLFLNALQFKYKVELQYNEFVSIMFRNKF